jgi:hypothetical protein
MAPAHAGDAVGAGLIGFGVGAILGSLFTPWEVYVGPPPYYYEPVVNASTCALSPSLVLSSIEPFNHQTKNSNYRSNRQNRQWSAVEIRGPWEASCEVSEPSTWDREPGANSLNQAENLAVPVGLGPHGSASQTYNLRLLPE